MDTVSRFARLEREWDALLQASGEQSHFMRCHWQDLWFKHMAPRGSRLHVILFRNEREELIGIAPLYCRPRRVLGIPLNHTLCLLGTGAAMQTSEHVGLLAQRGSEAEVTAAFTEHLSRGGPWHRLWLWNVPETSPCLAPLRKNLDCQITVCDQSYFVRTDVPWDQVRSEWTRKFRHRVDRSSRILAARQNCRFAQVTSQQELGRLWPEFVNLHQLRWARKGQPGSFSNAAFRNFLYQAMQRALAASQLRFWYCEADGKVIAALVAFVSGGTAHYFQGGFDPDFSKLSVGSAMIAHAIESCVEDPAIREFDFMGGTASYKASWTRHTRSALQIEYFRAGWIARSYALGRELRRLLGRVKRAGQRAITSPAVQGHVYVAGYLLTAE